MVKLCEIERRREVDLLESLCITLMLKMRQMRLFSALVNRP